VILSGCTGSEFEKSGLVLALHDDVEAVTRRRRAPLALRQQGAANGSVYSYDVNTNTNYNPEAESRAGRSAMTALARFLGRELAQLR
jgi:hypothetical protein